jgi:hypothetical protein
MVAAGVSALQRYDAFLSLGPSLEEHLIEDVLRAAFAHVEVGLGEKPSSSQRYRQLRERAQ